MSDRVKRIKDNNSRMTTEVANWNSIWQVVGEYITQIKTNFEQTLTPGEFLNEDIFDSTATFASNNSASALLGILWPSSAKKSIQIDPPDDLEDITEEERNWYEETATKRLVSAMDDPIANLALSLDEYMLDQVNFGTSGVGVFLEGEGLFYRSFSVKEARIDEGRRGRIDTVYLNYEWTAKRVVDTYGIEKVSQKVRDIFNAGKLADKVKILIAYEPAIETEQTEFPIQSTHIEIETNHTLKEGGFEEFPILMARFRKLIFEKYGRSPGMNALPDIRELNVLREAVIVATEKLLDPPLGVLNSGMLGGGIVDSSAGALTVFDGKGNVGGAPPIFPINTVGDITPALSRIEDLKESIAQHFFIDRLLDFNNKTVMTATETVARSNIRNASLASLISRQITELFTPLIERSFNILLRNDKLGFIAGTAEAQVAAQFGEIDIIPDRIAQRLLDGKEAYKVRYTTPADRITNAEELDGLLQHINLNQQLAATNPEAPKYLDIANINKQATRLLGSPPSTVKSQDQVEAEIAAEQQQIQQQQTLNQVEQVAGIASELQENK